MLLRIGITQRVEDLAARGERRDCLDQAFTPLLREIGFLPVPVPNRTGDIAGFIAELGLAGVILSGGNDLADLPGARNTAPERDALEREILEHAARTRIPVLGICRGLQRIATHYGGKLERIEGHVATRHSIALRDAGPLRLAARVSVNSFHDWGIRADDLPKDLCVAATASDGSVEALWHAGYPQAAIMWHPERPPSDRADAQLIEHFFRGAR